MLGARIGLLRNIYAPTKSSKKRLADEMAQKKLPVVEAGGRLLKGCTHDISWAEGFREGKARRSDFRIQSEAVETFEGAGRARDGAGGVEGGDAWVFAVEDDIGKNMTINRPAGAG